MFAALLLISGVGVLMYALLARLSALVLRHWHDSEARSPDRP
jgi:ABC-type nitrate/sulfonate/bicarbonate transport system permease component